MSYNPRQKKRNAQFRKKRFETKGRGGKREDQKEDVGAAAPGELTAARQPEEEKNTVKKQSQDTPTEKKHETAKYSRRKVSSNWERYDCGKYSTLVK